MRLLNVHTKLPQRFVNDESRPRYAILSHTWGEGNAELTLQELQAAGDLKDIEGPSLPLWSKSGFRKMWNFCQMAAKDGHNWIWMDTCLIDSTSSVELSEAINSMYRWYKDSESCYIYLEDVSTESYDIRENGSEFRKSRWFTRGWTLQEYIAPTKAFFFNNEWSYLGERSLLAPLVSEITGIPSSLFPNVRLAEFSIGQRMSWAANRKTSRKEDIAYCLLGIFDINMVPLYGEGGLKAFQRLQKEIIADSNDQTIFAWGFNNVSGNATEDLAIAVPALARSPADFSGCQNVIPCGYLTPKNTADFDITKQGVEIELPFLNNGSNSQTPSASADYAVLDCRPSDNYQRLIAIPLKSEGLGASRRDHSVLWKRDRSRSPKLVLIQAPMNWRMGYLQINAREDTAKIIHDKFKDSVLIAVPRSLHCSTLFKGESIQVHQDGTDILVVKEKELLESYVCFKFQSRADSSSTAAFLMKLEFQAEDYQWGTLVGLTPETFPPIQISSNVLTSIEWKSEIDCMNATVRSYTTLGLVRYKYGLRVRRILLEIKSRKPSIFGRKR